MVKERKKSSHSILMDIAVYAVWSLFVLIVSGCQMQNLSPLTGAVLILGFIGLAFFVVTSEGSGKEARLIAVITIAAVFVRTFYVLYTGAQQRQHDVGEFDTYLENNYHAEYIEYLLENHKLLAEDIRDHWQFYHPPFHHIVCAIFFGIYRTIVPSAAHNWDALQTLSLFWSLVTLAVLRKFLDIFSLSAKGRIAAFLAMALHPQLIVFAGALNNDPLALMLSVLALYLAWTWYGKKKFWILLLTGFSIGLGMMTKLSAGLVAVPIAFLMLKVLFTTKRKLATIGEYSIFLLITAPLGLWYQVRSLILWNVPITYVAIPDTELNPGLVISGVPFWKRFFEFGGNNYNIISETMDQAVFDGDYYRDNTVLALLGYFLLASFALLTLISLIGMILAWIKKRNDLNTFLTILLLSELFFYVLFCFRYPYTCTMSFRYIVPVIIAGSYYCGISREKGPNLLALFTDVAVFSFALLSMVFYCLIWIK